MKTTRHLLLALLLVALPLPLQADRQLTVTWDKYPEAAEIVLKLGDKELGAVTVNPQEPKPESITVPIPDGKVTLVTIIRTTISTP